MSALGRKLLRDFWQLRSQALAIALVLVAGVATLVMALSNDQALNDTREAYYDEYRYADVFARVPRAPLSLLETLRGIDGVREVEARVSASVTLDLEGFEDPVTALLVSLPGDDNRGLNRLFLREGRLPDPRRDDEVVVVEAFALEHGLRPGDAIVAIINGRWQRLRVVGIGLSPEFIYVIKPGELLPDFARFGVLWMHREALAAAFDLDGAFNDLVLSLHRGARQAEVIETLDRLLEPYGGIGAHGRDLQASHRFISEELDQLRVMTAMFSAIFLAVSAFLLNVVIGRLVQTQREQIAVLKAFGYSNREVATHYAALVLLLVGVGLPAGLLLGAWLGRGLADVYMRFYGFPFLHFAIRPEVIALALAFMLAAAMLGAWTGLRRIMRLAPAEAMRPEAPPVFRRTLAERLGLGPLLSPAMRMVLRNLERRPLRTLLSVLAIALGTGILVMSRFQAGAVEAMIATQFNLAQREDLSITFVEPSSGRAAQELAALPGVRLVEPLRHAAVVLRHGHREHRGALQGLDPAHELKRVLDSRLEPVPVPDQGLMLTDWLAQMLALRPGDSVEVEFLEGHRGRVQVPVVGIVREYLGVNVYTSRHYVNRLLREDAAISGALLALEPGVDRVALLERLREHPRIAGVSDRHAMMQSFRETMAEGILAFGLIATLMAASIAVGVVYNAARIALSERARELASLRVLGYTAAEIKRMLGGELMLLTGLALLPGLALGLAMSMILAQGFQSELYRMPLVLVPGGFALAVLVILVATWLASWRVQRRLDHLDLVAVLKTKE